MRRISFTTPSKVRQAKLEAAKQFYLHILEAPREILDLVDDCLEKKHRPDQKLVEKHNADPLNKDWQISAVALWEQSDVVHDVLAFLAEQMIDRNKAKQKEIAGFLKHLERTVGADVDDLSNKTLVKQYHDHTFDEVLAVLKRNKNRLSGFDPQTRANAEGLEEEFNESVAMLTPLKAKIQATDDLIDQIVYKLYGLTDEEIAIVEGSTGT